MGCKTCGKPRRPQVPVPVKKTTVGGQDAPAVVKPTITPPVPNTKGYNITTPKH